MNGSAPLSPLTLIAGAESSFGQNVVNPDSSARGVWQDLTATWKEYSCAVGYCGTYPTANDAPYSVQAAANAYGFNKYGFQPWSSNAVLMTEVANAGGASAFAAPGSLSTNPADYASLDAPGGLQAYFNANSGGSFVGSAPITTSGSSLDTSPNTSPTAKPFSFAYTLLVDGTSKDLNANLHHVQDLVHPWLSGALALSIMVAAAATMFGRISINGLASHIIRVSLVAAFVAPASTLYTNFVVNVVIGLPASFAAAFGVPNAGPTGVFDDSYQTLWAITETIFSNTPMSFKGAGIVLAAAVIYGVGVVCLAALFLPFIAVIFLLLLMLVIGPIAIVAALFRALDRWLMGYVDVMATLAISMLAIDIVVAMYQRIIVQMLTGFVPTSVGDKDIPAFGGLVLILFVMAFTVWKYLIPLLSRVFGGSGLALDAGVTFLASQATRAVRFATR